MIFDEYFKIGRAFTIKVTDVQNPEFVAIGSVKVYTLNYNANIEIENNKKAYTLEVFQNPIEVTIKAPNNLPFTGPITFYKATKQYISINFKLDRNVGANNFINVDLSSDNVIILGSAYISSNLIPFDSKLPIKYTYNGALLTISNINKLDSGTIYNLLVRVAISANDAAI
jgi:hypothetical protein